MSDPVVLEGTLLKKRRRLSSTVLEIPASQPAGRVPRISRLMALALRFEELVRNGEIADHAALARLGKVSRARITQIQNLCLLAPDIQEQILFLPLVAKGRDPIHLAQVQPIAAVWNWQTQRRRWKALIRHQP